MRTEMAIDNQQLLLVFAFSFPKDLIREEFLQTFAQFSVLQGSDIFYGSRSGGKPMKSLQFQSTSQPDQ